MTEGPMNWVGLNGRNHGEYWLLKSNHFHVDLEPTSQIFSGNVRARVSTDNVVEFVPALASSGATVRPGPALSLEEVVARTKPSVVFLKALTKSGSGFFVTDTGVIATNAHLARGEETLLALLSGGQRLEAKVVYVDADLDIALEKWWAAGFRT